MVWHGRLVHVVISCCLLLVASCGRKKQQPHDCTAPASTPAAQAPEPLITPVDQTANAVTVHQPAHKPQRPVDDPNELDFDVENETGKTLFVTCFSYQPRRRLERWHWIKSPVYEIPAFQTARIDVDTIEEDLDRSFVFGYLGVFTNRQEAEEAVLELLPDKQKLDLDLLCQLRGKKVSLTVERYGMKGELLEYDFVQKDSFKSADPHNDLIFSVENSTGKSVFVSCFVYQKKAKGSWIGATEEKDDMSQWRYQKMNVLHLDPAQTGQINVGSIITQRDKSYTRGDLAIFDETQEQLAYSSTYELLPPDAKLELGPLERLHGKKIVLEVENYGIVQDYFNYIVKNPRHIDFQGVHRK